MGIMGYDNPYLIEKKVVPRLAGGRRPDADSSGTGSLDTLSKRSGAKISSPLCPRQSFELSPDVT